MAHKVGCEWADVILDTPAMPKFAKPARTLVRPPGGDAVFMGDL